jgi:hypothetical protein
MASTYAPQRAFDYAKKYLKLMNLEVVAPTLLDDVNKIMWMAAPWRWTIGAMPTVSLIAAHQDYAITVPGDFLYLLNAYLSDGVTAPRPLRVEASLPTAVTLVGQPGRVAMSGAAFRLSPTPGTQPGTAPTLVSLYKKIAPIITAQNMNTAGVQVFDDEWFWVFQEGVNWRAYMYGDDQRAGSAQASADGKIQYTGQRAIFEGALQVMMKNEKLPLFDTSRDEKE